MVAWDYFFILVILYFFVAITHFCFPLPNLKNGFHSFHPADLKKFQIEYDILKCRVSVYYSRKPVGWLFSPVFHESLNCINLWEGKKGGEEVSIAALLTWKRTSHSLKWKHQPEMHSKGLSLSELVPEICIALGMWNHVQNDKHRDFEPSFQSEVSCLCCASEASLDVLTSLAWTSKLRFAVHCCLPKDDCHQSGEDSTDRRILES